MVTVADSDAVSPRPHPGRGRRTRMRVLGALLGVAVALGGVTANNVLRDGDHAGALPDTSAPRPDWTRPGVAAADLPARLGIRLTQVTVTGGGGLIDLRFQVVDPELASAIHDPRTPPALVLEPSGLFINQLLMGHEHSGPYRAAETYYLLFLNSGGWVHAGDRATVLLGGVEVTHVKVG